MKQNDERQDERQKSILAISSSCLDRAMVASFLSILGRLIKTLSLNLALTLGCLNPKNLNHNVTNPNPDPNSNLTLTLIEVVLSDHEY